jgi:peptidoglycan/xylan/chitin deacetylase (PgdA/CDA1 family)
VSRLIAGWSARIPVILMYHSISAYRADPYLVTVRPERLDQQMHWLRRRGLFGVSVGQLLTLRRSGCGAGHVGLTFDDGYADFAVHAVPILRRYGFTATVFPVVQRLGLDNGWDPDGPRKPLMSAEQLRQVAAAGMEIGSHGLRHVSLPAATDGELASEVGHSRYVLREISGQDVAGFCYPWGHLDGRVVDQVRSAGYSYGCAISRSPLTGSYALPRNYIGDRDSSLRLWAKGACHWLGLDYSHPGAPSPVRADFGPDGGPGAPAPGLPDDLPRP